jgi:hypothetical protein
MRAARPAGQGRSRPGAVAGTGEETEQLADGGLTAGRFGQGKVRPDLVAVAAAVLRLADVPGLDEVGDDRV